MTTVESNSRRESINCEFCILNCEFELVPSPPHSFERLLFTPAAGYRARETGILDAVGTGGHWWLSSSFATGNLHAGSLDFGTESVSSLGWLTRSYGVSVRCVQHLHDCFLLLGIGSGTTFRSENKNPLPIIKARDVFERLASALEREVVGIVGRHSRCRSGCRLGRCCCRSRSRITGRSGVRSHGSSSGLLSVRGPRCRG